MEIRAFRKTFAPGEDEIAWWADADRVAANYSARIEGARGIPALRSPGRNVAFRLRCSTMSEVEAFRLAVFG
jgi:hypothetical protein